MTDLDPATVTHCADLLRDEAISGRPRDEAAVEALFAAEKKLRALLPKPPTVREVLSRWLDGRDTRIAEDACIAVAHGLPSLAKNLEALAEALARESAAPSAGPDSPAWVSAAHSAIALIHEAETVMRTAIPPLANAAGPDDGMGELREAFEQWVDHTVGASDLNRCIDRMAETAPAYARLVSTVRALVERSGGR